jgi:four helix bundle protein
MMGKTSFEKLEIYQLASRMSDVVWEVVSGWAVFERDTVGKQLIRAMDGVAANLAEGAGRGSEADNRRFIYYARGSLYETKHWLRRAHHRGLLSTEDVDKLQPMLNELLPRLNAYLNAITRRANRQKSH